LKGIVIKLGQDFWFWVRLIIEILKAILGFETKNQNPSLTAGHRAFNAVCASLVDENEDDAKKASDLQALVRK